MSGINTEVLMASYVEDNISQGKGKIFDSDSTVHACSHKDMFYFLVAKEKEIVKIVDGSACKIINTETVNIIGRDGMVRALKAVRYVREAQYNLIFIRVLDKGGCRIQVQQGVVTISQGEG